MDDHATTDGTATGGARRPSDRELIADFILANEAAVRRRIERTTGRAPGIDADDIFSTTLRRVDGAAARGSFRMRSAPEAWSFVARVVQRAVQRHRLRAARLAEAVAGLASQRPAVQEDRVDDGDRAELARLMRELERVRPQDAELIQHRLRGHRWREVSDAMGVTEEALRQRWSALMRRLRERMSRGQDAPIVTGAGCTRGR
jgi:RNA polymerase sigma factor (sigma-70 family)